MKKTNKQYSLPSSALRISAVHNDLFFIKKLIRHRVPLNQTNDKGYTALHMAVLCGREEVVELLLKAGASPNTVEKLAKRTPLYDAVRLGYQGIVSILLNHKADSNIPDIRGDTPIIRAAREGLIPVVYQLARKGARLDVISSDTLGVIASMRYKTEEMAQWLKRKGAPDKKVKSLNINNVLVMERLNQDVISGMAIESMIGIIAQAGKMDPSIKIEALDILKKKSLPFGYPPP